MKNISPIIGVDVNQAMYELTTQMGADTFVYDIQYLPQKCDVIIDTTGIPDVISKAFEMLNPGGRLILVGQPAQTVLCVSLTRSQCSRVLVSPFEIQSQGGRTDPEKDIPRYINLKKVSWIMKPYILIPSHSMKLMKSFDLLRSGEVGRIMVKIHDNCD